MQRTVSIILPGEEQDGTLYLLDVSGYVATALGLRRDDKRGGVKIGGCGTDVGFEVVHHLSYALFPDSFVCTGSRCPANDHNNGDRDYTPHQHSAGAAGYALLSRWL